MNIIYLKCESMKRIEINGLKRMEFLENKNK
jgi:hypothetical protein